MCFYTSYPVLFTPPSVGLPFKRHVLFLQEKIIAMEGTKMPNALPFAIIVLCSSQREPFKSSKIFIDIFLNKFTFCTENKRE